MSPESVDFYRVVRGQLEHEDSLVTNRTSWFLSSQSFLFTAYAILANGYVSTPRLMLAGAGPDDPRRLLLAIIPGVSVVACLLTSASIWSGVASLHNLRRFYDASPLKPQDDILPPVQGYRATRLAGMAGPVLLPIVFLIVWLYLLGRHLF